MAIFKNWKPKTAAGKILKGATIGVGAIAIAYTGVGAIGGAIGGSGILAGAAKGLGAVLGGGKKVLSKVGGAATKLVTGQTKEENKLIRDIKKDAKEAANKLKFAEKLKQAGASATQAAEQAGLSSEELASLEGQPVEASIAGIPQKTLLIAGAALLGLLFLPKLLKR